ncbi:MAG TPA: methionyl-tRNA formyltransferase [Fibrobacteria bacterium]|nr:methionyl-tRNA formyltransferase [Fibrobacteria bacterium]
MKLIFMGTPEFAVAFLETLYASRHQVALVVTQPDRPKGRGRKLAPPPVKEKALELGLPVAQPVSLKAPEFHDLIREQNADLLVVVAYRILPDTLFPLARFGAVNVHGSLLPKFRGAAPIQWAVATGEAETGVTVFQLDKEIDHGGILARAATPIGPDETSADLFARLKEMGRDVLMRVLDDLEAGRARPEPQDHGKSSPAPKLRKEDGRLDWTQSARCLHDRIRGFNPYPVCYAVQAGTERILRIHASRLAPSPPGALTVYEAVRLAAGMGPQVDIVAAGTVRVSEDRFPLVATGEGWLKLVEVQWEGKPRVSGPDFVNGLQPAERKDLRFI